jgi:hypothetical protein
MRVGILYLWSGLWRTTECRVQGGVVYLCLGGVQVAKQGSWPSHGDADAHAGRQQQQM